VTLTPTPRSTSTPAKGPVPSASRTQTGPGFVTVSPPSSTPAQADPVGNASAAPLAESNVTLPTKASRSAPSKRTRKPRQASKPGGPDMSSGSSSIQSAHDTERTV
jgi:hypothetical protein